MVPSLKSFFSDDSEIRVGYNSWILSLAGFILTISVLFAVMKLCIYKGKSPFYILTAANMLADSVQLVLATTYLAPSIMADIFSDLFVFCWYYGSITPAIIAVNRYALQFCAISIFYFIVWVTFLIFPMLIGPSRFEYFIVISISLTMDASMDALIYISMNTEVQAALFGTNESVTPQSVSFTVNEVSSNAKPKKT
ncbi:hypothetical protein OESDEN_19705 [Oesophagostomum dentatum]|uniref:Uncharacterized protein n=1 Tax=Oesophagostomum dentatum TaxID=61180 RepID=A0A0B1S5K0_OESDE|nr:hypothetical protein OESDEN_19705 [Oesophagostomum dentatum]